MNDEVLAGLAPLIGVVHARVHERLLDALAVDRLHRLIGVLLDDREQVAEQPALGDRQLRALDRLARGRVLDPVDRRTGGRDPGRAAPATARAGSTVAARAGATGRASVAAVAAAPGGSAGRRRAGGALGTTGCYTLARRFALLRNLRPSSYRCA
jgi:hypothetical protein